MVEIKSAISNQKLDQEKPMRKFVVSDEEQGFSQEQEEAKLRGQIDAARQAKIDASSTINNKISASAKKRLEILSGLGRGTKDIPVDGVSFSIRTLKSAELREIIKAATQADEGADSVFEARANTLARVIYKIDGQEVGLILGDDSLETKLNFVQELDEDVAQYLYREYTDLVKENKKKFPTVEEEIKEVSDQIKKS